MREIASFILKNRFSAILLAAFFGVISVNIYALPLALFSAAAVALVTLRNGIFEGALVIVGASIVVFVGATFIPSGVKFEYPLVFLLWLPVLIASTVLRESASQGYAIMSIGIFLVAYVAATHLALGDVTAWWANWLETMIENTGKVTLEAVPPKESFRIVNGLVAMFYGFSAVLTLFLGRWWQSLVFNPGGFGEEFRRLAMPRLALVATIAILILAGTIEQTLLSDLFIVAMLVFAIQGLSVLHAIIKQRKMHKLWLLPAYLALFRFPNIIIVGLALLGAVDTLMPVRKFPND